MRRERRRRQRVVVGKRRGNRSEGHRRGCATLHHDIFFPFFSLSLRFVTTGLVYLSAILVCRFCCLSPVFSIVSRSRLRRRLLSAGKHNGEQLLWRIVIFSMCYSLKGLKLQRTNEQNFPFKRSIHRRQLFLKAIKSISGYYWMKLMKLCLVVSLKCELIEDYY